MCVCEGLKTPKHPDGPPGVLLTTLQTQVVLGPAFLHVVRGLPPGALTPTILFAGRTPTECLTWGTSFVSPMSTMVPLPEELSIAMSFAAVLPKAAQVCIAFGIPLPSRPHPTRALRLGDILSIRLVVVSTPDLANIVRHAPKHRRFSRIPVLHVSMGAGPPCFHPSINVTGDCFSETLSHASVRQLKLVRSSLMQRSTMTASARSSSKRFPDNAPHLSINGSNLCILTPKSTIRLERRFVMLALKYARCILGLRGTFVCHKQSQGLKTVPTGHSPKCPEQCFVTTMVRLEYRTAANLWWGSAVRSTKLSPMVISSLRVLAHSCTRVLCMRGASSRRICGVPTRRDTRSHLQPPLSVVSAMRAPSWLSSANGLTSL